LQKPTDFLLWKFFQNVPLANSKANIAVSLLKSSLRKMTDLCPFEQIIYRLVMAYLWISMSPHFPLYQRYPNQPKRHIAVTIGYDHSSQFIFIHRQVSLWISSTLVSKHRMKHVARESGITIKAYRAQMFLLILLLSKQILK
jgi:AraC-like DNA-binding protein